MGGNITNIDIFTGAGSLLRLLSSRTKRGILLKIPRYARNDKKCPVTCCGDFYSESWAPAREIGKLKHLDAG